MFFNIRNLPVSSGSSLGLSADLVQRLVGIVSAFQGLLFFFFAGRGNLGPATNNQILRPQTTRFWGETKRISLYKSLYGWIWPVLIIDFAVEVPLLCGSYPVITKGHLPFRPRAASANLQADGASNLYFLEICRIRVPQKLEPCDVSGGSSSISHDSSFWGWHTTPVLCIDVSTVSHIILMGLVIIINITCLV